MPKPARSIGLHTAPGMWASSNCWSVRTSTSSAPCDRLCSTWRGASGIASTPSVSSGPLLSSTIAVKFGGCGPSLASASSTNRSSSSIPSVGLWRRSKPIVEEIFRSMPGPPHIEPPRWAGQTSHSGGQVEQRAAQGAEDPAGALGLLHREVGPGDVADEQRVAAEHGPRRVSPLGVGQGEGGVLGAMAGRVQGAHAQRAERELPAVVERLVRVVGLRGAVDVDGRAGRGGQAAVPGHVVGVVVGLEDVLDAHAHVARQLEVLVDLEARIDHGRHAGVLVADQVGRAAEIVVGDLAEDHARSFGGGPPCALRGA